MIFLNFTSNFLKAFYIITLKTIQQTRYITYITQDFYCFDPGLIVFKYSQTLIKYQSLGPLCSPHKNRFIIYIQTNKVPHLSPNKKV